MNEFEIPILDWIQAHLSCTAGDLFFGTVTHLGDAGVLWILLTFVLLISPKTRKYGVMMGISLVLNALVVNVMIKPLVARTRPYDVNTVVELLIKKPIDFSFPSGHSSASFAAASALVFGKAKGRWWAFGIAVLIAFSRLYLYVHYPTDVLVGAIIGVLAGWAAVKLVEKRYENHRQ